MNSDQIAKLYVGLLVGVVFGVGRILIIFLDFVHFIPKFEMGER